MPRRLALPLAALLLLAPGAAGAQGTAPAGAAPAPLVIGVLRKVPEEPPWVGALERAPEDLGLAGARIALRDNETTGRLLGQAFALAEAVVPPGGDHGPAFADLLARGVAAVVLDVPADDLLRLADAAKASPAGRDVVLLNAGAPDDRLRGADCRDNLLHVAPSRAMLADALAQYLVLKRWRRWLLVTGRTEADRLYAEAVTRAARKFGATIVARRTWDFGADARATAQAEVPGFTQGVDHDVLVVADEGNEFGDLLPYRTWDPRPVAGTQGLTPASWHPLIEAWGGAQLQSRFRRATRRGMTAIDFQMWEGVRAVGEAATRARSADPRALGAALRAPEFELATYKGVPLTFRDWDGQLRQAIPLSWAAGFVSMSPQAGFLHQRTPLDTLGTDKGESACPMAARSRQ